MKTPTVMLAGFSPRAAIASLMAFLISLAAVILSLPGNVLSDHFSPALVNDIRDIALIITGLAGVHLSTSRSLLPQVDNTTSVEVPSDHIVQIIPNPNEVK